MPKPNAFHIPSLDGIRGLAALTVFVSHAALPNLVPGGFGVTVFFFLSGYLITTLLRMEYEQHGAISLRRFYLRRVYRILPPMYIVLALGLVLAFAGILPHRMSIEGVLAQFAHLTNYFYIYSDPRLFVPSTSVMWSLAVEEHFYLLFPLAISLLFPRLGARRIAALLLLTCGLVLAWRCWAVLGLGLGHGYTYYATEARLDSLLYGCIMGVWLNPMLDRQHIRLSPRQGAALVLAGGALLLVSFLYRSDVFRETFRYTLQGIALFPLFFCAVRYHHWPLFAWLDSRPMRVMGLVSYTFYLVHLPCLTLLELYTRLDTPLRTLAGFLASLAVSGAMYLLVERHLGKLRRRLHSGEPRAAAPALGSGHASALEPGPGLQADRPRTPTGRIALAPARQDQG